MKKGTINISEVYEQLQSVTETLEEVLQKLHLYEAGDYEEAGEMDDYYRIRALYNQISEIVDTNKYHRQPIVFEGYLAKNGRGQYEVAGETLGFRHRLAYYCEIREEFVESYLDYEKEKHRYFIAGARRKPIEKVLVRVRSIDGFERFMPL